MAKVLNINAVIKCIHGGTVTITPAGNKLKAGGAETITGTQLLSATIAGCTQIGSGLTPCTVILAITAGQSTKLKTGGVPILLDTLTATTNGVPTNGLQPITVPGQIKLTSI